jgi:hypothetical protein
VPDSPEGGTVLESQVIKEWIEKTSNETRLQVKKDALLQVLASRFPGAVAKTTTDMIFAERSQGVVDDWTKEAIMAGTIDDFVAVLHR